MKRLLKISALAAVVIITTIAVMAAVSCSPSVEVSDFDWDRANAPNNADKGSIMVVDREKWPTIDFEEADIVTPAGVSSGTSYQNFVMRIDFETDSPINASQIDALRETDIAEGLSKFLSFHTINRNLNPNTVPSTGNIDPLSTTPNTYEFVRREGNVIYVKLTMGRLYNTDDNPRQSQIIAKIDGTTFTHSNGLLLDVDGNGTPGETGYDDIYLVVKYPLTANPDDVEAAHGGITYPGVTRNIDDPDDPRGGTLAGSMDWKIVINALKDHGIQWSNVDFASRAAITDNISAGAIENVHSQLRGVVANDFKNSFQLQQYSFSESKWLPVGANSVAAASNNIVFNNITLEHLVPYRVVWIGGVNPEVAGTYYGVKQRLTITGGDLPKGAPAEGEAGYKKYVRSLAEINGPSYVFANPRVATFVSQSINPTQPTAPPGDPALPPVTPKPEAKAISFDTQGRNVIIQLQLRARNGAGDNLIERINPNDPLDATRHGLRQINNGNLDDFKKSVKVLYRSGHKQVAVDDPGTVDIDESKDILLYDDVVEVDIINVQFRQESDEAKDKREFDTIWITLDPSYEKAADGEYSYLYINNGLGFTDGVTFFGNPQNWENGFFQYYEYITDSTPPGSGF